MLFWNKSPPNLGGEMSPCFQHPVSEQGISHHLLLPRLRNSCPAELSREDNRELGGRQEEEEKVGEKGGGERSVAGRGGGAGWGTPG